MNFYTLEYKQLDNRGREKTPKYVGVFKSLDQIQQKKEEMLQKNSSISFQIYSHTHTFNK